MKKAAKFKRLKTSPDLLLQADHHDHAASSIAGSYDHKSTELVASNDDLLTEILIRLPDAKSLFRFKIVSKQWLSLLSTHPRFSPPLFDKRLKSSGLYYGELPVSFDAQNPNATPPFRGFDFSPGHIDEISIVQSCNGLLLCRDNKYYSGNHNYYVCNPTTKKVAAIPPVDQQPWFIRLMGLSYHPTECVHYKLVCIHCAGSTSADEGFSEDGNRMYKIQIYSSQTGRWKKLKKTFTPEDTPDFQYGVYWNGAFYWVPLVKNPMYLRLDNEKIQDLPMPPVRLPSWGEYMPLYFGESRGHLHLVDATDDKNPLCLNVYEMLRDHSGWFINYKLDLSELRAAYPNMMNEYKRYDNAFRVLDVVRGGEEENTFLVVKALNNIKRYTILDQSFTQLFSIPDDIEKRSRYKHVYAHRYIGKIGSF